MKIYYPKDKNGNQIGFRTPESYVFDKTGKSLTDKLAELNSNLSRLDTKKSDKTEVDVERKRIDTFVALKDGSTTGDAELTDIRVGYDGITYDTAGNAVRGQIKDIHTSLDAICLKKINSVLIGTMNSIDDKNASYKKEEDGSVIFNLNRPKGSYAGLWMNIGKITDVQENTYIMTLFNKSSFIIKFDILISKEFKNWVNPSKAVQITTLIMYPNSRKRITIDGSLVSRITEDITGSDGYIVLRFENSSYDIGKDTKLNFYVYKKQVTEIMNTVMNAENAENAENAGFVKPNPLELYDNVVDVMETSMSKNKIITLNYKGGNNLKPNTDNGLWAFSIISFDITEYIGKELTIIFDWFTDNYFGNANNFNITTVKLADGIYAWGTIYYELSSYFSSNKKRVELNLNDYYDKIKDAKELHLLIGSEVYQNTPNDDGTYSYPVSDRSEISFSVKFVKESSEVIATSLVGFNQNEYEKKPVKYITCWGDSLTAIGGWTTKLQELSGIPVYNGGTGGENARTIVARQGADAMVVNNITIPADTTPVTIASMQTDKGILTVEGNRVTPLLQGGAHVNPCKIGDTLGTLKWTGNGYADPTGVWTFTRAEAGSAITINRPTILRTDFDMNRNAPYLMIIFIGQNGGYSSIDDLIRQHRLMIEHANAKHFIVLGLSSGSASSRSEYEARMKKEFGRYFISLREYLAHPIKDSSNNIISCYGLDDQGLEPGSKEYNGQTYVALDEIATGTVPHQILMDTVHYTDGTRKVVANLIYKRCKELNIF